MADTAYVTPLDLARQLDDQVRGDVFFNPDAKIEVGRPDGGAANYRRGRFWYDSGGGDVVIDADRVGAGLAPTLTLRRGGVDIITVTAPSSDVRINPQGAMNFTFTPFQITSSGSLSLNASVGNVLLGAAGDVVFNVSGTITKGQFFSTDGRLQLTPSFSTPSTAIMLTLDALAAPGTRDSHNIFYRGRSHDGSSHDIEWRHFVDVTSNAGASTFKFQSQLDGGGFADRLTIDDSGNVLVPGKLTVTGAIDPTFIRLTSGTTDNVYVEWTDGQTVPVSSANEGRIRYNANVQSFQVSENGGAWADLTIGGNAWLQGGNSFSAIGQLGTNDNYRLSFRANNAVRGYFENGEVGEFVLTGGQATSGSPTLFKVNASGANHTTLAAAEAIDIDFALDRSVTFNGFPATQRAFVVRPPRYSIIAGGGTLATAATFAIAGPPTPEAGATITNAYSFWVQSGQSAFPDGTQALPSMVFASNPNTGVYRVAANSVGFSCGGSCTFFATQSYTKVQPLPDLGGNSFWLVAPGHTALAGETKDAYFNFNRTVTWAGGGTTTLQRAFHIYRPVYQATLAHTITTAATVYIEGAPVASTGMTIPNSYALYVDGATYVNGKLTVTGAIDPTSILLSGGTALYFESNDGQTAPVSGAATGRIRYNNVTGKWETSVQGGAYAAISNYANPLTTKGDMLIRSNSTTTRLPVGANDYVIVADSSTTDGVAWKACAPSSNAVCTGAIKNSVGTINPGQVVYIAGWSIAQNCFTVELAQANAAGTMPAIGIAKDTITNVTKGRVQVIGEMINVNTGGYAVGDTLYVSAAAAGVWTNVRPTGTNIVQIVGRVANANPATGVIEIIGPAARNTNLLPNLAQNYVWVGNASALPTATDKATDWLTQYALLAGRAGGQTLYGGTVAGNNLTLASTSNATKGAIIFGTSQYDEVNNRLGLGVTPETVLDVNGAGFFRPVVPGIWTSGAGCRISYDSGNDCGEVLAYNVTTPAFKELRLRGSFIKILDGGMIVDNGQNFGIGQNSPSFGGGTNALFIQNGTNPAAITDGCSVYCRDVAGSSELFVLDEGNNETQLSTHNKKGDWIFYSVNKKTGRTVYVNMEKFIRRMEELSGEKFIFDNYLDN